MHRSTIGKIEAGERVVSIAEGAQFAEVLGIDLTELIKARHWRLVQAQMQVRVLEGQVIEYTRQRDEAQVFLDLTLPKLEEARARLKELEAER